MAHSYICDSYFKDWSLDPLTIHNFKLKPPVIFQPRLNIIPKNISAFTHISKLNSFVGSFYGSDDGTCAFQSFFVFFFMIHFNCIFYCYDVFGGLFDISFISFSLPSKMIHCCRHSVSVTVRIYAIQIFSYCIYIYLYIVYFMLKPVMSLD